MKVIPSRQGQRRLLSCHSSRVTQYISGKEADEVDSKRKAQGRQTLFWRPLSMSGASCCVADRQWKRIHTMKEIHTISLVGLPAKVIRRPRLNSAIELQPDMYEEAGPSARRSEVHACCRGMAW